MVPQELYALQLRCSAGDAGQLCMSELFDQWRTWLACIGSGQFCGAAILPDCSQGATLASLGASRSSSSSGALQLIGARILQLGTACTDCGDPTRRVCWACCVGLCSTCFTWRQPCGHCGQRRKMLSDYGSLLKPTSPSWSSLWCCMPWSTSPGLLGVRSEQEQLGR